MIKKEDLKEIIKSQRKWITKIESGIERDKKKDVRLSKDFVLVISGIRRCGKSTLLKQILSDQKDFYYLNLEDPKLEDFELKDFTKAKDIFKEHYGKKGVYFFDEIQNISKWETFIRYLVDRKNKVLLTGSNASLLSRELGTKLTGRHRNTELFSFSYKEFLKFFDKNPSKKTYNDFLFKGGFPEFLKTDDETVLNDLLKDVIMRDIAVRFGIKNTSLLEKLGLFLLSNVGKEFSYNSLKKMFKIKSVQSVIDYMSYFEDAYLLFIIPLFSYSYKKQQINPKKVYSIDNGLSKANSVSFSKDKGRMLENNVFLGLRRRHKNIFYFKEKKECDFLIKEKEKITKAFQVCYELNDENQEREIGGLAEALNKFKLKQGIILTFDQEDEFNIKNKKIIVKPVWKWSVFIDNR